MTFFRRIASIRDALDDHNGSCRRPAKAILLHPDDHARLGFAELWGVPVMADKRCREGFLRIDCEGSAWQIEAELAAHLSERARRRQPQRTARQSRASQVAA